MDAALRDHIRYLELRLRELEPRPELHRHQLVACRRLLELAGDSSTASDFRAGPADLFELSRAEWLDRFANASAVQQRLGDPRKQAAAAIAYDAATAAAGPDDFAPRLSAAMVQSVTLRLGADAAHGRMVPLLVHLLDWVTEREPTERLAAYSSVHAHWNALLEDDPGCTWGRLSTQPSYRRRIPFADGPVLDDLGRWLAAAVGDQVAGPAPPPPATRDLDEAAPVYARAVVERAPPAAPMVPTPLADAAAGYRVAYDTLQRDDPAYRELVGAYERILAIAGEVSDTHAFQAQLVAENLPVRLARARNVALARDSLAHCRPLSQPHAVYHHSSLVTALEACRSTTEVEHLLDWAGECFAVEKDWNEILLAYALRPLRAIAAWALDPRPERQATVVASYQVTAELFGRDAAGLLAVPRLWDFFSRALSPELAAAVGARRGEVGLPIAQDIRKIDALRRMAWMEQAFAQGVAEIGEPPDVPPEAIAALVLDLLARALGHDPAHVSVGPAWRQELVYWDRPLQLDELVGYLYAPPRPRPR